MSSPFAVLGLPSSANRNDVRKAYHELARKYHPDRGATSSGERMKKINAAYNDALHALEDTRHSTARPSHTTHRSQAPSSHRAPASSSSSFRFEPATFSSSSTYRESPSSSSRHSQGYSSARSAFHSAMSSARTSGFGGSQHGSSSRSRSSRHGGSSSRAEWSSRYDADGRPTGTGTSSRHGGSSWVTDAREQKTRMARDVETEYGFQSRRLERLTMSGSRDRGEQDTLMQRVSELEQRLANCRAAMEDFEDWIEEGKEMDYF